MRTPCYHDRAQADRVKALRADLLKAGYVLQVVLSRPATCLECTKPESTAESVRDLEALLRDYDRNLKPPAVKPLEKTKDWFVDVEVEED